MDSITIEKTASGKGLWVTGQTSPHRNQLKEMGGKWNTSKKSWVFSLNKQQELLDYFKLTTDDIGQEEPSQPVVKPQTKTVVKPAVKPPAKPVAEPTQSGSQVEILKTKSGKGLWVQGDTRNQKDKLMELGGKWNGSRKAWVFSIKKQEELLELFGLRADEIGQEE